MFLNKLLSTSCLLLISIVLNAQIIQGEITDESNNIIINANVINKQTKQHAHTNISGSFIIEATLGDTLLVSCLGYKSMNFIVSSTQIKLKLKTSYYNLNEVVISPEINALNLFSDVVLHANPVNSSQEILQQVPGLFIGQHAGGGKAEQIFMRGFDIDHGTDVNIEVDGLPVNMVSHAHGQGYADLHFLIPETVEQIGFGKGCYYADKGNFTTAGYVDFKTKERLSGSLLSVEVGQFNTSRILGMYNIANKQNYSAYIASEYILSDGAFDSPQNFNRMNILGKATASVSETDKISLTASYFSSQWDASGQVPQRAVDDGAITRFGAIDDTEGGFTGRTNISVMHNKNLGNESYMQNQVYYSLYDFDLYSNFTFYLNDPVNGDQIKQTEKRGIYGVNSKFIKKLHLGNHHAGYQIGVSLRNDQSSDNELSRTLNRSTIINTLSLGDINETNFGTFFSFNIELGRFSINPSVRADLFKFVYNNELIAEYTNKAISRSTVSPKLNILYNYSNNMQLYAKAGKGFHSNDTRVVIAQSGKKVLPAVYGSDFGVIWKPIPNLMLNTAMWYLFMQQEFVYVGDEGVVEPGGETVRRGADLSARYQPVKWLFMNFDVNYAIPVSLNEPESENYLPLAPTFTMQGGIHVAQELGIYGSLNFRHMADRPANEDNSIVAKGYTVVDANLGYLLSKFDFGIQVQNLFNTEWNETQFANESRLLNETEPVEEIHFIPGIPFFIKGSIAYKF